MKKFIKRKGGSLTTIFWTLIAIFVTTVIYIFIPMTAPIRRPLWPFFVALAIISFLLGVILIFLTLKKQAKGWPKRFLLLTGISVIGMPISIVLHNFIYGLFIYLFGQNFWERIGLTDEPVFFIIAIFLCPIGFLVGAICNIVLLVKQRKKSNNVQSVETPRIKPHN